MQLWRRNSYSRSSRRAGRVKVGSIDGTGPLRRRRAHWSWRRARSVGLGLLIGVLTLELVYRLVALPPDYRPDRHEASLPLIEGDRQAAAPTVAADPALIDLRVNRRLDHPPHRGALSLAGPPADLPSDMRANGPAVVALAPLDDLPGLRLNRLIDRPAARSAAIVGGAPAAGDTAPAGPDMASTVGQGAVGQRAEPDASPSPPALAAGLAPERPVSEGVAPVALPVLPRRPAPAPRHDGSGPLVAVVIDDMGYSPAALGRLAAMPGPLTLAFLPYAEGTPGMLDIAARRSFELMLHLPMEPLGDANPGAEALLVGLDEAELRRRVRWAIDQVPGAIGVNNHMGSRFTADLDGLEILMEELRARGLYFLDSRTNPASIAERVALAAGIPTTGRDIFIDHDPSPAFIARQLAAIERTARANGDVIAIGHPYPVTLAALEAWLPTLAGRGFRLARASEVLAQRLCARAVSGAEPCGPALHLIGYAVDDRAGLGAEPAEATP